MDDMLIERIKNAKEEEINGFRKALGLTPIEMLKEEIENSVKRKKRLMRLEKEHLVDMVFNLESRNEMLTNNLLEVEKMYDKLKEEKND